MAALVRPFKPIDQATVSLSGATTTSNVALGTSATEYLITNTGAVAVFVRFGDSGIAATLPSGATGGSTPVPAGAAVVYRPPLTIPTHVAVITATSTATVYVTAGEGI